MVALPDEEVSWVVRELTGLADEFAERAREQEARRDRSLPGTGPLHHHAHSATLWRSAERRLRARVDELDPAIAAAPAADGATLPRLVPAQSRDPLSQRTRGNHVARNG